MSTMMPNKVFSVSQLVALFGSILISLGSGTNYIYSAYAPQLGACLRVSHTQLNIIGLAGNLGVYIFTPIWGRVVDHKGPRTLLASALICLPVGYLALRLTLLVVCSFMTGLGSCAGFCAALNTTARSFPARFRATTTALTMSAFGLSAFFFSLFASTLFPGDVSTLLLTLAIGTATPMLMGLFIIKPAPLPTSSNVQNSSRIEGDRIHSEDGAIVGEPREILGREVESEVHVESTPLLSHSQEPPSYQDPPARSCPESIVDDREVLPNIYGKRLWLCPDFYLIFTIMTICTGTGLMYINNVGSISHVLYATTHPVYDDVEASKWQAAQVSILSLASFAARVLIGLVSDFTYTRFGLPRAYCFCIVSSLFIVSQVAAIAVSSVETLWMATVLVGLAYGSLFGSYATVVIEWFGLVHFSENTGYVMFAPVVGGNLFSLMFGYILDTHVSARDPRPSLLMSDVTLMSRELPSGPRCLDGKTCYLASLHVTLAACIMSLGLSWLAGIRDGQKVRARNAHV